MTGPAHPPADIGVTDPQDLDADAVLAVAAGATVTLASSLREQVVKRREEVMVALSRGAIVYGVTTGMGALSDTVLNLAEQAEHSQRLMLARAVGGPPWLDREETRAMIAVRLRNFLEGDAGVSEDLCVWLTQLLRNEEFPSVPRTGYGAAGEIVPLAHAWGHLAGVGSFAPTGTASAPPSLGPKEGIALLAGVPVVTALSLLRARDMSRLAEQAQAVAAAATVVTATNRDCWDASVARGDAVLARLLRRLRTYAGAEGPRPRHLQAPVSFRVAGPVFAHLEKQVSRLRSVSEQTLAAVTDSPAFVSDSNGNGSGGRFVGTPGFHGLELAAALDGASAAGTHVAATGAARMHRMLDTRVTGLPAQLSADPGPEAGLTPLHKRAVGIVHTLSGWSDTASMTAETSNGQEDVQTFALEAAERLRLTIVGLEQVVACELLAVHQANLLAPDRMSSVSDALRERFEQASSVLPRGTRDRPWGQDVERLVALLRAGW